MISWVGDSAQDLSVHLYTDADFAGDKKNMVSTSGVHLVIRGKNTCFPLNALSKTQTAVSHSTPEAELVAADIGIRTMGIPCLALWNVVLQKKHKVIFTKTIRP